MTREAISAILEQLCNHARNSVHVTMGLLDLLRETFPDRVREPTHGDTSADQLLRMIDDFRELVSNEPWMSPVLRTFDAAVCVGEIVEVLNVSAPGQTRHSRVQAPTHALFITQDQQAVEQVLTRVLDAAFKLSSPGELIVSVQPETGWPGVVLSVSGHPGVTGRLSGWLTVNLDDVTLQDALDVPVGLGVMVAGKRIRMLDGRIEYLGSPESGRLTIGLPSRISEQPLDSPEATPPSLSVLVAEDCDESFDLSNLLLADERVWRAHDGLEAIDMMKKRRFDVVLMDVHMPGMDGYAAIRTIRHWETETGNARTPVVILSSDNLDTQKRCAAQSGCSAFLRKPLRRGDLMEVLDGIKEVAVR